MQNMKKIVYKLPIINKYVKKWEKCNKEILKLKAENEELGKLTREMDLEIRRNSVYREMIFYI